MNSIIQQILNALLNVRHNWVLDKGIQKMNGIGLSSNESDVFPPVSVPPIFSHSINILP